MDEGRGRLAWSQTSLIAFLIYDGNRGKGSKRMTADDFNPYAEKKKKVVVKMSLTSVIPMIVGRR